MYYMMCFFFSFRTLKHLCDTHPTHKGIKCGNALSTLLFIFVQNILSVKTFESGKVANE